MGGEWVFQERDYAGEEAALTPASSAVRLHPLDPNWKKLKAKKGAAAVESAALEPEPEADPLSDPLSSPQVVDPLGASGGVYMSGGDPLGGLGGGSDEVVDPLRGPKKKVVAAAFVDTSNALGEEEEVLGSASTPAAKGPWRAKKNYILQNFTVAENVQIKCSFLNANKAREDEGYLGDKVKPKLPTRMGDANKPAVDAKTQRRLEELEDPNKESEREFKMMSMREYIDHLENLNAELKVAWRNEERVKSLRIAIQCAKLLTDTSVAVFYPSMFVLVTEILDTFGSLVFERIKKRSLELSGHKLREDFNCDDVHPEARETCRNWFFKVASIRELVPRLYVEMALVPCYRFLTKQDHLAILSRLGAMMRGVSGPIVSVYMRAYLGRVGAVISQSLSPSGTLPQPEYLVASFFDFLLIFKRITESEEIKARLGEQHISYEAYMRLMAPALEWIMFCVGAYASKKMYGLLLKRYCDGCNSSLILHSIITAFPANMLAPTAQGLVHLIRDTATETMPQYWLFASLGEQLAKSNSDEVDLRGPVGLAILNDVWKIVSKYEDIHAYMQCAPPYVSYVLKYRKMKEVGILLADILKHIKKAKADDECAPELKRVVLSIVEHPACDFQEVLRSDSFQKLLDHLKGTDRNDVYKAVMRRFTDADEEEVFADPVLLHTLLHVGRSLHDALDSLSFSDEQRQITELANNFISKISFGTDFEQQLNFYLECRAAFPNLEGVRKHLVLSVLSVLMKTLKHVKGRHTKRTAAFAKACLAYTHITVPSLENIMDRLELYLRCAQAALLNQFLPQTDTFAMTAISQIPDYAGQGDESKLVEYIQNLLGWLVVVPGHPDKGPFYLVSGLQNVVAQFPWEKEESKVEASLCVVGVLSAFAQKRLPYCVERVVSNDELFAGEENFLSELTPLLESNVKLIIDTLSQANKSRKQGGALTIRTLNAFLRVLQPNHTAVAMALQLFDMAEQMTNAPQDRVFLNNTRAYVKATARLLPVHQALVGKGK